MKKKSFLLSMGMALCLLCVSCATGPVEIPEELSSLELIQRAQEAADRNRYKISIQYYQALLERNRINPTMVCTAEYEIAFIHYKEKKYEQAKGELNALLARYEEPDAETLPPEYKILADIVLKRIEEQQNATFILFGKKKNS